MTASRAGLGLLLSILAPLFPSAQALAQDADAETAAPLQELPPGLTVADVVLDGCCDYFGFGFCLDIPFGTAVERSDSARVDVIHDFIDHKFTSDMSLTGLASGVITYSVHEGSVGFALSDEPLFEPAEIEGRASETLVRQDDGVETGVIKFEPPPYDGWPTNISFWYRAPVELAPVAHVIARGITFDGEDPDRWSRQCIFERLRRD